LYTVAAVIIMDMEGKRLLAKYYDIAAAPFATLKSQQAFERTLFARSSTNTNSIAYLAWWNDNSFIWYSVCRE